MIDTKVVLTQIMQHKSCSLNALAVESGIPYPTLHNWMHGKVNPSVNKFSEFLEGCGYRLKIVTKTN